MERSQDNIKSDQLVRKMGFHVVYTHSPRHTIYHVITLVTKSKRKSSRLYFLVRDALARRPALSIPRESKALSAAPRLGPADLYSAYLTEVSIGIAAALCNRISDGKPQCDLKGKIFFSPSQASEDSLQYDVDSFRR